MKLLSLIALALFAQSSSFALAAITPDQLREFAKSSIQCEQKKDGSDVSLTFENCKNLQGSNPSCEVIANTDDGSKKLMDLLTWDASYDAANQQLSTLLSISLGDSDGGEFGPTLSYDRYALLIDKDGTGFYFHQRSNEFWSYLFPVNDQMDFQNCKLSTNQ